MNQDVALMTLDIKMPGKNGLQVYEDVKAQFPGLPIIFYSAYQSVLEDAELSRKYRPFNYIPVIPTTWERNENIDSAEKPVCFSGRRGRNGLCELPNR